ncbi:MAG: zinc-dependent alcohol dehydrogenase [Anaerolineae bacterium]|jgi:(R,R)-butanediol dehydrogenase/meso-butanediol dehydrogenase/diacetyl reductase
MAGTMRAARWMGTESVITEEVARPEAGTGEALVRVALGGICGTDLMIYLGKHPRAKAPLIMCHEFVGTLADPGDSPLPEGAPVAINPLLTCGRCYPCTHGSPHICEHLGLVGIDRDGGFAQYALVPTHTLCPLPEGLAMRPAALIEPLAVAVHAVRVSRLRVGDTTAVLGAGPVGILTAQVARHAGASRVLVSEVSPRRLEIARALGFDTIDARSDSIIEAVQEATGGAGAPVVFETAGVQPTISAAAACVRAGGEILQVGMPKTPPTLDITRLLFAEISMTPIRVYREEDVAAAIEIAASGALDLDLPVTHVMGLDQLADAMELAHAATDACKILIDPNI